MSKLWEKGYSLDQIVEQFTIGDDYLLDQHLITYDCVGSIAHATMLKKIGVLSDKEYEQLATALSHIIDMAKQGSFVIQQSDEDVHTAVENFLTKKLGDVGKKIHTARSRNDQVNLDLRLYMRDQCLEVLHELLAFCATLAEFAQAHQNVAMPGRTHFQTAMPSSMGLFAGALLESLLDNAQLLINIYPLINQCPLGSAASYGVNLPINRQYVADLLGFEKVQNNVLYVGNSRGKFESIVLSVIAQIMQDLAKLSTDLIIFSASEFGYVTLPKELCSGSSLMPQKRNPDGLELVRAKSATVISDLMQTLVVTRALPSGYNRDFQETKRPLMNGFKTTIDSLIVCNLTIKKMSVNADRCIAACTQELFATDKVLELVQKGVPFRQAYQDVAQTLEAVSHEDPVKNIQAKTHLGAPGNLGIDISTKLIDQLQQWVEQEQANIVSTFKNLMNIT